MKVYKAFYKKFPFELGKLYKLEEEVVVSNKFPNCKNPIDVVKPFLGVIKPDDLKVYVAEITYEENTEKTKVIKFIEEIKLDEIYKLWSKCIDESIREIENDLNRCIGDKVKKESLSEYKKEELNSVASTEDNNSRVTVTSHFSIAANTGGNSITETLGDYSVSVATALDTLVTNRGRHSIMASTGHDNVLRNIGAYSIIANLGGHSKAVSRGSESVVVTTGCNSTASVEGNNSIAIATGWGCKAKGSIGCYLVLAERDYKHWELMNVKTTLVDGERIKADTYYRLQDGEFIECN